MRAVITAGGRIAGEYARVAGTTVKALARVRGRSMLSIAIDAVRGAGAREVAVVGGEEIREACGREVESVVDESASGAENLRRSLHAWPEDDALLYVTSDLPYVTSEALKDFSERARGALAIAVAEGEAFDRRFPGALGFGIRLGKERVVNGGAFLLPAATASRVAHLAARFFDVRKSRLRMASLAGAEVLLRYALGTLTLTGLERRATRVLGLDVRAVRDCAPELAYDADDLAAYRYAREHP